MTAGGSNTLSGNTASAPDQTALLRWQILRRHVEDGVPLTTLAEHEDIGLRILQRWHAAHKRDGLAGLGSANRGTTRRRAVPELVALIEGLVLVKPPLPIAVIARKANRVAADHGWASLSYGTVRSITAGIDPGLRTLAQQGAAAYRDTYELAWRHRAKCPNELWQTDHTELDILALDANLKPGRPWLTTILVDYSRAICGYMLFLVHFQGLRYVSPLLAAYVREPIIVRHDPRDITEIRIFHKNQFICRAMDPDHQSSTLTLKDIQAARSARRRELRGQINQRIAVVARHLPDLASAKQTPAPVPPEQTRKRPKLRTYLEDDQ